MSTKRGVNTRSTEDRISSADEKETVLTQSSYVNSAKCAVTKGQPMQDFSTATSEENHELSTSRTFRQRQNLKSTEKPIGENKTMHVLTLKNDTKTDIFVNPNKNFELSRCNNMFKQTKIIKSMKKPTDGHDINRNKAADVLTQRKRQHQTSSLENKAVDTSHMVDSETINISQNQIKSLKTQTKDQKRVQNLKELNEPRGEFERRIDISTTALAMRSKTGSNMSITQAFTPVRRSIAPTVAVFPPSEFDNFNAWLVPLSRKQIRSERSLKEKKTRLAKTKETSYIDDEDFTFTQHVLDSAVEETYEAFNQTRIATLRKSPARIIWPCRLRRDEDIPGRCGRLSWAKVEGEVRVDSVNVGTPRLDLLHAGPDSELNRCYFLCQNSENEPWKSPCPCISDTADNRTSIVRTSLKPRSNWTRKTSFL